MAIGTILGFPRIGRSRELKTALESYWLGNSTENELLKTAATLRATHWKQQHEAGLAQIPCNDFSLYDQVLDMSALFGVVPDRYKWPGGTVDLATYFAMARGRQKSEIDVPAAEMKKWFDTNYHYIVPEFSSNQNFKLSSTKPVDEFKEAKALGIPARPVLIGPITYLLVGKRNDGRATIELLERLLPVYVALFHKLEEAGVSWVQLDEPALVTDLDASTQAAYTRAYVYLKEATKLKLFVATYFGPLGNSTDTAVNLPIDALHIDLVRGISQLDEVLVSVPSSLILSMGIIDGRNIWRSNLEESLQTLENASKKLGKDRVWVSASCSLLHVPYDLERETRLDPELKSWIAFAAEKIAEIVVLAKGMTQGRNAIAEDLVASAQAAVSRRLSRRVHDPAVQERMREQPLEGAERISAFGIREAKQRNKFNMPLFPTTTIGSFPQTSEVRKARADFKKGLIGSAAYEEFIKQEIKKAVALQEEIGLDILVHGEFERTDMVEYFGEQLEGFAFTQNGWVQSYGSRCVKPPIIYSDVWRPKPMTVTWAQYAQGLTKKPMKGMLTGPVTILQWSFVRNDQLRQVTAHQIALALQDEVLDLERAGINIIQIDEPAFREGLPLRRLEWRDYLAWAVQAFRLCSMGVQDETQIHTHMCYSKFNDIISSIRELDADVISIETSRSKMELLEIFINYRYPNGIGPGVYDIHSPRVPSEEEIEAFLEKACERIDPGQLWVNPDCGLKTRDWPETKAALAAMVAAARAMRKKELRKKD